MKVDEVAEKLGDLSIEVEIPKRRIPTAERIRMWEEEQKSKTAISTGLQGKVKWYSVRRRYGFIARNDGEKDVFVHQTAIARSLTEKFYLRTLGDEEEVLFDLVEGKNGPEASNVTGPDGQNVVGSKYRHQLLSRFRKNRTPKESPNTEESSSNANEASPQAEGKKKPRKQRKPRTRKPKTQEEKGAGDAADVTASSESTSAAGSPDSKSCSKIIDEEAGLSKVDRCESALGEAGLGAQPIDAQI